MEGSDGRRLTSKVPSGNSAELRRRCPNLENDEPDLTSGGTPQDSALNHSTKTAGSSASGFANHRETREEGFHVDSGREIIDDHWQVLPTTLPGTSSIATPHDDSNNSAMSAVTGRPGGKARRTFPKKASCFEVHGNRFVCIAKKKRNTILANEDLIVIGIGGPGTIRPIGLMEARGSRTDQTIRPLTRTSETECC
uniref:GMC_OxRdtase_N domain-containing protein n=1 Tax=Angiostrongylus cantonensis TaxID=6313 RepID=A0A0K0D3I1_ANGCA